MEASVADLENRMGELDSSLSDLDDRVSAQEDEAVAFEDIGTRLDSLCHAIGTVYVNADVGSAVEDAFFELDVACS